MPMHPATVYHIYNRGNNREDLFKEERNYPYFLDKYFQYVSPVADTYAYCLMKNHFHILLRIKNEDEILYHRISGSSGTPSHEAKVSLNSDEPSKIIIKAFASFFKSYAQSINKAYGRTGSLFEEPFRRIEVSNDSYFSELVRYIHFNPQKHGFTRDFTQYKHSSYHELISEENTRLDRETVSECFGGMNGFHSFHLNNPWVITPSSPSPACP
jgi:REP element-mobilizing transposase RayT